MSLSLLALLLVTAPPDPGLATAGRPAELRPVVEASARCSANPQLVIALTQYAPPPGGDSSLAVSLRTDDGRIHLLGHAGIFPAQAFSVTLADAHRFGFAVPRAVLRQNPVILVALKSEGGKAAGGRAVIGDARITPAPRDRGC